MSILKSIMTRAATGVGAAVAHWPTLEAPFVSVASRVHDLPLVGHFSRVSVGAISDRLRRTSAPHRPIAVGSTRLLLDVTVMGLSEAHFLRIPLEPSTVDWVQSQLTPGDVFIDIGANVGYYTLFAAALVGPEGRVFAFEPNPEVRVALHRHLELNRPAAPVTVVETALSDRVADDVDLVIPRDPSQSGFGSLVDAWALRQVPTERVRVSTDTFDRWRERTGLDRIDVMKIDVEGGEELVLRGMTRTLAERPPAYIFCETTVGGPAHALLTSRGYACRPLEWMHEASGYGNLLFSRS